MHTIIGVEVYMSHYPLPSIETTVRMNDVNKSSVVFTYTPFDRGVSWIQTCKNKEVVRMGQPNLP